MTDTTTTPSDADSVEATLTDAVQRLVEAWLVTWDSYPPGGVLRWQLPIEQAIDETIADVTAGKVELGQLLETFARQAAGWLADAKHAERQLEDAGIERTERGDCYCEACDFICGDEDDDDGFVPPICVDCEVELLPDTPAGSQDWQRYMVHDQIWADAGMDALDGWLCIPCLEIRIARPLIGADLKPDLPINCPDREGDDDTPRLAQLKRAIPNHRCGLCDDDAVVER
jgi:hypothetical protein